MVKFTNITIDNISAEMCDIYACWIGYIDLLDDKSKVVTYNNFIDCFVHQMYELYFHISNWNSFHENFGTYTMHLIIFDECISDLDIIKFMKKFAIKYAHKNCLDTCGQNGNKCMKDTFIDTMSCDFKMCEMLDTTQPIIYDIVNKIIKNYKKQYVKMNLLDCNFVFKN